MKGKINKNGRLLIIREGGVLVGQQCHHREMDCGDWCPLFANTYSKGETTHLGICHKTTLIFEEFTDERFL
jgi:hypothetical protein